MRYLLTGIMALVVFCPALSFAQGVSAMPHTLVYKAKKQYRRLVAVQLSDDRKRVVSYPDPIDVKGITVLPMALHKGYWLDNRGVGKNTAFIKLTYEQYAKLKAAPRPEEFYKMIVDKQPIKTICDCGARGKYSVQQINGFIDSSSLVKHCTMIK